MALTLGFDPTGIDHRVAETLDGLIATLQVWAAGVESTGRRVDIPYHSRYFSVDSGTITTSEGIIRVFAYIIIGDYLLVMFDLQSISVTGTPNIINITAPEGFRVKVGDRQLAANNRLYTQPCLIQTDVGSRELGEVWVTNNANTSTIDNSGSQVTMHVHQVDDGVWGAGTTIGIYGHCLFEFERV